MSLLVQRLCTVFENDAETALEASMALILTFSHDWSLACLSYCKLDGIPRLKSKFQCSCLSFSETPPPALAFSHATI